MRSLSSSIGAPSVLLRLGAVLRGGAVLGEVAGRRRRGEVGIRRCPTAVNAVKHGQRSEAADGLRRRAPDLRAGRDLAPGGKVIQQLGERGRVKIVEGVAVDLRHRRVAAGAKALDFDPGELAVRRDMPGRADALFAYLAQLLG